MIEDSERKGDEPKDVLVVEKSDRIEWNPYVTPNIERHLVKMTLMLSVPEICKIFNASLQCFPSLNELILLSPTRLNKEKKRTLHPFARIDQFPSNLKKFILGTSLCIKREICVDDDYDDCYDCKWFTTLQSILHFPDNTIHLGWLTKKGTIPGPKINRSEFDDTHPCRWTFSYHKRTDRLSQAFGDCY